MGVFLSCGIAHTIYIKKIENDDEDMLSKIGQNIDLDIYDRINEGDDNYMILQIKKICLKNMQFRL